MTLDSEESSENRVSEIIRVSTSDVTRAHAHAYRYPTYIQFNSTVCELSANRCVTPRGT